MKALRKNVDERYQTLKELESDLKKLKQRLEFHTELERSMGFGNTDGFAQCREICPRPTLKLPALRRSQKRLPGDAG